MKTAPSKPREMKTYTHGLDARSLELRRTVVRILDHSRRGHVGSAFSLIEILRVLYDEILRYNPGEPKWFHRDRCILSKGHGCLALYVILAEKGFFPESELWKFCQSDSILGGHPDHRKAPGVEVSTGSLGHGFSMGIGMALNARHEKADYRTFVIIGDGESNEGSVWEAAMCASKHRLSNLTIMVDYNKNQSYSSTFEVLDLEPIMDKWKSFGFAVVEVDGHSVDELRTALTGLPLDAGRPTAIICHTVKGKGIDFIENDMAWHHQNRLTDDQIQSMFSALELD